MSENGETSRPGKTILSLMDLDFDACYRAIAARDARFDGRFFTGVRTTRRLLPADLPGTDASARERQLLSERRRGTGCRLSPVPALPARDLAGARRLARHLEYGVARPDAHRGRGA
jgi:AraC family transcriptional regulator, regulatory protein of adaptative response / DNA-3-methyladenine glycosylase II